MQLWCLITKKTPKEDILIPNVNVPEYTDINELSCLLGIKPPDESYSWRQLCEQS